MSQAYFGHSRKFPKLPNNFMACSYGNKTNIHIEYTLVTRGHKKLEIVKVVLNVEYRTLIKIIERISIIA